MHRVFAAALGAFLVLAGAGRAAEQTVSGCAVVAQAPPRIRLAAQTLLAEALKPGEARISFIGHASFLIESPAGVAAVTDYNDVMRAAAAPDIATMNKAHSTHNSARPEAGIKHLLRGWSPDGGPARHNLIERDMRVRNVSTNIRDWGGGTERDGNSIFVFETAGLCIAHLGHLHHTLDPARLAELGRVDVLMIPVDGSFTMDQAGMIEVIDQIRAPLMLPMHFFSGASLERFIARMSGRYEVKRSESGTTVVSRETLPDKPTLLVLPGRMF
jgi:L-ascorbate metabolism protein UlaG (beta-lactamase superfamily)